MLNLNDLRLGDLLTCDEHICKVISISLNSVGVSTETDSKAFNQLNFQCIPLDQEWMSRLSGNERGYMIISELERQSAGDIILVSTVECYLHKDGFLRVCAYDYERYADGTKEIHDDVVTLGYQHIRYVHQLQHLYYDLTGKELILRKKTIYSSVSLC